MVSAVSCRNGQFSDKNSLSNEKSDSVIKEFPEVKEVVKPLPKPNSGKIEYGQISDEILVEDLDGDGYPEVVSLVSGLTNKQIGVRVLDGKDSNNVVVFGAGNEVDGMTDLSWIEIMNVIPVGDTIAPTLVDQHSGNILGPDESRCTILDNPAISFRQKEVCGGGILYWNGTEYVWLHIE